MTLRCTCIQFKQNGPVHVNSMPWEHMYSYTNRIHSHHLFPDPVGQSMSLFINNSFDVVKQCLSSLRTQTTTCCLSSRQNTPQRAATCTLQWYSPDTHVIIGVYTKDQLCLEANPSEIRASGPLTIVQPFSQANLFLTSMEKDGQKLTDQEKSQSDGFKSRTDKFKKIMEGPFYLDSMNV